MIADSVMLFEAGLEIGAEEGRDLAIKVMQESIDGLRTDKFSTFNEGDHE